jgi:hypothetical protein
MVSNEIRRLAEEELNYVGGGMTWDRGYVSPNVIDARGGTIDLGYGFYLTVDLNVTYTSAGWSRS